MTSSPDPPPELAALLRLKRYEQPPPGYVEEMVRRVQQRQREAWQRLTPWQWWRERWEAVWIGRPVWLQPARWAPAGAMALLLLTAGWLTWGRLTPSESAVARTKGRAAATPRDVLPLPENAAPMPGVYLMSREAPEAMPAQPGNGLRRTAGDRWVLPPASGASVDKAAGPPLSQWDERVVLVR